jgi:hypothetical protein
MGLLTSTEIKELREKLKRGENNTLKRTEAVLSYNKASRNNDIFLMQGVWELEGCTIVIPNHLITMKLISAPSSIFRARRKIQNDFGKYPPTDLKVAQVRGIKEEVMKDFYKRQAELGFRTANNWREQL